MKFGSNIDLRKLDFLSAEEINNASETLLQDWILQWFKWQELEYFDFGIGIILMTPEF